MMQHAALTAYWDAAATGFDDEPDHGLREDTARDAWAALLRTCMPGRPADVLDAGCGTGSLSCLLAGDGHRVTGVDISSRMVGHARAKLAAAGLEGRFLVGDATAPPTGDERFDVLLSRHLMWTLPDPWTALREWVARLRPGGTLLLVEGRWREAGHGGVPYAAGAEALPWHGGIGADELAAAVSPLTTDLRIHPLSGEEALWGGPVTDERYALVARVRPACAG